MRRHVLSITLLPVALYAGCSCQQEYSFPAADPYVGEAPEDHGSWLSMDTTPDGARLTIAYYDREAGALGYAVGAPQADGTVDWVHEKVDGYKGSDGLDRGDRGKYASQRTAPDGTVWVAYQDAGKGGLYVARRTGGPVWSEPELVDAGAGAWASLALDAAGHPVVAHFHEDDAQLRVSRFDGAAWSTDTVREGAGSHARLLIHDGTEHIAFYDAAQGALSLLEGAGGDYAHTVVDDDGDVGQWPSLWTDGATLRVAYHDVGQQDLKLATREAGSWSVEVVDAGEYRGADTEVFQRGDRPAVLYFDGYENDMMLATRDGDAWVVERAGSEGAAVGFHNEVARLGDTFWLASYDFTAGQLYVVTTN